MKVLIKNTVDSAKRLYNANVPTAVINELLGKTVDASSDLTVQALFVGQLTEWNIPAECVTILSKE